MPVTKLTPEQKVARVRDAYDKLSRRDFSGALEAFSDDAAWHGFIAGDVKGKSAIKGGLDRLASLDTTWKLHDVLANDQHVVALHEIKVSKGGTTAQTRQAMVAHISDDGKISELWTMGNPQDLAAFLAPRQ